MHVHMMFACSIIVFLALDITVAQHRKSYRELIESSPHCKMCTANLTTTPPFCNIVAFPLPDYKTYMGRVYEEDYRDDPCYCALIGSIFYEKDPTLPACTRIPNMCTKNDNAKLCEEVGGTCVGTQWSTFHCTCPAGQQGQLCNVPLSAGQVVKNPILVNYLNAPLFQRLLSSEPQLLPGLYFIAESLGDDFQLIVNYLDGRRIQVTPSSFTKKNYRQECLTDIKEKIYFTSEFHCKLIPEGNVYGYGIFLDHMVRQVLETINNFSPTNKSYTDLYKSAGRNASLEIEVRNKGEVTWQWDSFQVFVPYQRQFLACARFVQINGCNRRISSPALKSFDKPIVLRASNRLYSWCKDCDNKFYVYDHRWYVEDVSNLEKLDDMIPGPQLPEKYSYGVDGDRKTIREGDLSIGRYMVVYDLVQKGDDPNIDTTFVRRQTCYFSVVGDTDMRVYLHTRKKSVVCNKPFNIDVNNYNARYFDNERLTLTWTCEGSSTSECGVKQTKGTQPYTNSLKCGVTYKFTVKATHPKTKEVQTFEVEIVSEDRKADVEIERVQNCGYKLNPDKFMYLKATERPPISTSWKWEIREVTKSSNGKEIEGKELADTLRQPKTEANIYIVPPYQLAVKKEYRIYARTPAAYSSYTFTMNEPPEGGLCIVDPKTGVSMETQFLITCKEWSDENYPITYRVLEIPNPTGFEVEPLARSDSDFFEGIQLRRTNIMVLVLDTFGSSAQYNLTVTLTKPTKRIDEEYVKGEIKSINEGLTGGGQLPALNEIDELTRKIEVHDLTISEDTKLKLLEIMSQIDTIEEVFDLEKALNVLNYILDTRTPEPKQRSDEAQLAASRVLRRYAEIAESIIDHDKCLSFLNRQFLSTLISRASCKILLEKDPVIEEDIVAEEIHEEHVQRVKKGKHNVLQSMATIGRALTNSIKYQQQKQVVAVDCFTTSTKADNSSLLPNELTVGLPYEYYKNESADIAVITSPDNGLMGVVTPEPKGPIDIFMQVPNYHNTSVKVSGKHKPIAACPSETKLDKNLNIHTFQLPDGDGVVVLNYADALVGKTKVFAKQAHKPSYANTKSSEILKSNESFVVFSNRQEVDSQFYVAMVAANEEKLDYNFTYRILRCSIYEGGQFITRGCTFKNLTFHGPLKNPTVHCRCNLSSDARRPLTTWFGINIITPPPGIVLSDDVHLFSVVANNFYTTIFVLLVLAALIAILMWARRLDIIDERCRTVIMMEDNYPGDGHAYVIAVFTGQAIGSGTSSRVAIRVFGEKGYSRVHMLDHSERQTLNSGRDDWFLMTTEKRLGRITRIQMWHNHNGMKPEWYCKKISVFDLEDHVKYEFIVERWFTFDNRVSLEDARMYDDHKTTDAEVSKKWYLLVGGWVFSEMREKHHLASIFRRHPRSLYSRCQRVIIGATFIMTTLLVSMMFFTLDEGIINMVSKRNMRWQVDVTTSHHPEVGPSDWPVIPFALKDVWTGIKSAIISSLITLAVVICFSQHKKYEKSSLKEGPTFEVTDANETEQTGKQNTSEQTGQEKAPEVKKKRTKLHLTSYQTVWVNYIKPVPSESKPVVLGVKKPKMSRISLAFLCAAWIIASITIAVTSSFVIMYGLKFGQKKSTVWGLTVLTGAFSNAIIFAPLKMLILGLLVALTSKKSYLDSYTMQINIDPLKLARKKYMDRLKWNFRRRLKDCYKPCLTTRIERFRSRRIGRETAYLLAHSVMVISMFAVIIWLAALLGLREGFYHIRQLNEVFTGGLLDEDSNRVWNANTLEQDTNRIWNKKSMYKFFSQTAVPAGHRLRWYNNKTLGVERNERKADPDSPRYRSQVKGFVKDYTNKLIGVPRLRQQRLSNSSTKSKKISRVFRSIQSHDFGYNLWLSEDHYTYLPSWEPYDGRHGAMAQVWSYFDSQETYTGETTGYSMWRYDGGGYVIPLSWNLGHSLRKVKNLEMNDWTTNRTRCTFLVINVYNNNMKLFSVMRFIVEALPSGIYWNRPQMDTVIIYLTGRPKSQAVLLLVTILLALLLLYAVLCMWSSSRDGLFSYLSTWRGFSDLVLISVGLLTVSSQYNRALHFSLVTEYMDREPRDKYTSLFAPLATKSESNKIFCIFCLVLMFNLICTLFKFKMYTVLNRVLSKVYKLWITASIILNLYGILISILWITQGIEFGKFFAHQFIFREEIFHKITNESKIFYVLFTPFILALFKFHVGYLASSQDTCSKEYRLPTFFVFERFRPKKPMPLPRRKAEASEDAPVNKPPRSQTRRKAKKLDDSLQLIQ